MQKHKPPVRVLLVEDDEDDYVLFQEAVDAVTNQEIVLTWVDNYEAVLSAVDSTGFDMLFVDYRLNGFTGLELLNALQQKGHDYPFVLLTGQGDYAVDLQAMEKGASDYLEKDLLSPQLLERVIRYALSRAETLAALKRSEKHLRMLSEKLIHAQEAERTRIARELHDSTSSKLTAIKYAIEKQLYRAGNGDTVQDNEALRQIIDLVKETSQEVQRIYSDLRPTVLDDLGILAAVRRICRNFEQLYAGIVVENELHVEEAAVPEKLKIVIYRVVQEALNNIARHSGADRVCVTINRTAVLDGDGIQLAVTDNGRGFDVDAAIDAEAESHSSGFGLISMRERVVFSGGSFSVESSSDDGTQLMMSWPAGGLPS
ncbi:MAG: sensor histidine kinase [Thermodesulfobacteriota bacterium]|nr:sensor histidine kinase [Thermodesulfobacteriota bacterium]